MVDSTCDPTLCQRFNRLSRSATASIIASQFFFVGPDAPDFHRLHVAFGTPAQKHANAIVSLNRFTRVSMSLIWSIRVFMPRKLFHEGR